MLLEISFVVGAAMMAAVAYFLHEQHLDSKFQPHKPNELVVKFTEGTSAEEIDQIHRKARCEVLEKNEELGTYTVKSTRKMRRMLNHYEKLSQIEYAEPNYTFKAFYTPNDPFFSSFQYGLQRVQAPSAWDVTQSTPTTIIAILDTGVDPNHPDLRGKLLQGYDFVERDLAPNDANGHGTHVAGIAAAVTNNAVGIAGMAPRASILPVRVLGSDGSGSLQAVANGIIYAANQGAQVINLSLGSPATSTTLQNAIQYAWNRGTVIVAAAGNENSRTPNYPANYPHVIAVAATNQNDTRASFSNYGRWVEVAAPGQSILSTYPGSRYTYLSGTSMAAPYVAGLAALLAAQGRSQTQIRDAILNTADPVAGTGVFWVHGRINAARAVRSP
ncbi:S8 family peptidase [Ammoniphilus sp. YIM 78166]|uniref:S8 family peptidase n=1 Tax=Ammoniphilus sp. YIM 78166 TaxID=1644106 RepID=UPI00106F9DBB|nr:S8 family peptidase [Ammoniphilus sp. YIM 78166]